MCRRGLARASGRRGLVAELPGADPRATGRLCVVRGADPLALAEGALHLAPLALDAAPRWAACTPRSCRPPAARDHTSSLSPRPRGWQPIPGAWGNGAADRREPDGRPGRPGGHLPEAGLFARVAAGRPAGAGWARAARELGRTIASLAEQLVCDRERSACTLAAVRATGMPGGDRVGAISAPPSSASWPRRSGELADLPRSDHGHRRAPGNPAGVRQLDGRGAVDDRGLPARAGVADGDLRAARRPLRPARMFLAGIVFGVASVAWRRSVGARPDRRPPGAGRGAALMQLLALAHATAVVTPERRAGRSACWRAWARSR